MNRLFLWFLVLMIVFSCKKEKQKSEPEIRIISPIEHQQLTVPDSIDINIEINSESIINDLKVSFVNNNLIPVSDQISLFPSDQFVKIDQRIYIDYINTSIMVSPYYLSIVINNEDGTYRKYVQVSIDQVEFLNNGYVMIDQMNSSEFSIKHYDLDNELVNQRIINGVFNRSEYSLTANILYLSESLNNRVYGISLNNLNTTWEIEPQLPYPEINDLTIDENILFYSSEIGRIIGKNSTDGTTKITTTITPDTIPNLIGISYDYIITDFTLRNPGTKGWYTFYKSTGAKYLRYFHNYETVEIFPNNNSFVMFCNNDSTSEIILFEPQQNEISKSIVIYGPITKACFVSSNSYLYSVNEDLFLFDLSSQSSIKILSIEEQILDIKIETRTNVIYMVTAKSIYRTDFNGNNTEIINSGNDLKSMELTYGPD